MPYKATSLKHNNNNNRESSTMHLKDSADVAVGVTATVAMSPILHFIHDWAAPLAALVAVIIGLIRIYDRLRYGPEHKRKSKAKDNEPTCNS